MDFNSSFLNSLVHYFNIQIQFLSSEQILKWSHAAVEGLEPVGSFEFLRKFWSDGTVSNELCQLMNANF